MANINHDANGKFTNNSENVYTGREKEYKREWYLKNKERMQKLQKERYQLNKARYLLLSKAYQAKHLEQTRRYKRINKDRGRFGGNRQRVLERDNFECQLCASDEQIVIHHIDGTTNRKSQKNANNDLSNLITLCRKCHLRVHRQGEDIVRTP